jgi:hypothetical protein
MEAVGMDGSFDAMDGIFFVIARSVSDEAIQSLLAASPIWIASLRSQ